MDDNCNYQADGKKYTPWHLPAQSSYPSKTVKYMIIYLVNDFSFICH